ncbi:MAG: Na/Pi cotransporter family protein [Candidatus Competibacterales bacterium]|nr:Na/Pi cotransporter family protein [Candidatus Competibacterales bacterium]
MTGFALLVDICGGVALLLWAARMVRTGIERAYGTVLRNTLGHATRNRFAAYGIGMGVAAALQSSTATALLAVALSSKSLLGVAPALALMLGADLGSTLVVQVLSFDIAWLSPALIFAGVALFLSTEARRARQFGRIVIGLGLMLLALRLIVAASEPLRDSTALRAVLDPLAADPLLALLLAALLTWLAHSSVAMVLLVMSLTSAGLIPLQLGLVLVLGANVGSGLIPLILTLNGERPSRRIPLGNLLFRFGGALAVLGLMILYPLDPDILGTQASRQIANFHTLFNLALGLLCLPLTRPMARLVERLLPESPPGAEDAGPGQTSHLDPELLDRPAQALACATREVLRMAERVETLLRRVIDMFEAEDKRSVTELGRIDDEIDRMNQAIKLYLTDLSRNQLSETDSRRCMTLTAFTIKLEQIGDVVDKGLLELARKKVAKKLEFSSEGWRELTALHARVVENIQLAVNVFLAEDREGAHQLIREKERVGRLERRSSAQHLSRLRDGQLASIETSAIHLDILRDLKQINSHLTSVAYLILQGTDDLRAGTGSARQIQGRSSKSG